MTACGNGKVTGTEKCDDGGLGGCLKDCSGASDGYSCTGGDANSPSVCSLTKSQAVQ